jgi:hypothetical protein
MAASLLVMPPAVAGALPEGLGLAARYPGDRGIAKDPAVVLTEDFEEGSIEAVIQRWENVGNKDGKAALSQRRDPSGKLRPPIAADHRDPGRERRRTSLPATRAAA